MAPQVIATLLIPREDLLVLEASGLRRVGGGGLRVDPAAGLAAASSMQKLQRLRV